MSTLERAHARLDAWLRQRDLDNAEDAVYGTLLAYEEEWVSRTDVTDGELDDLAKAFGHMLSEVMDVLEGLA